MRRWLAGSKSGPSAAILTLIVLQLTLLQPAAALQQQHVAVEPKNDLAVQHDLCNQHNPTRGPLPWFCAPEVLQAAHSRRAEPGSVEQPKSVAPIAVPRSADNALGSDSKQPSHTLRASSESVSSLKSDTDVESSISKQHTVVNSTADHHGSSSPDQDGLHQPSWHCNQCPYYSAWEFPYETYAPAKYGTWARCICTGGDINGEPFVVHQPMSSIAVLEGWRYPSWTFPKSHAGIQALRVTFFDGTVHTIGTIPNKQDTEHRESVIRFRRGETIDGKITVSTAMGFWDHYTHVSYIQFRTDMGQWFEIGNVGSYPHGGDKFLFDAHGKTLTGLFGTESWNVDQIGFLVPKAVSSMVLQDFKYPGLSEVDASILDASILKPQSRGSLQICYPDTAVVDEGSSHSTEMLFKQFKEGSENRWTIYDQSVPPFSTFEGQNLENMTVNTGLPQLAQAKKGKQWVVGPEAAHSAIERRFQNVTETFEVICPPASTFLGVPVTHWARYKQQVLEITNLAYIATAVVEFVDGTNWTVPVQGQYSGSVYAKGELVLKSRYPKLVALVGCEFVALAICVICGGIWAYKRYLKRVEGLLSKERI